jgi:hypothetical protein
LIVLIGESFFTIHANSAIVSTLSLTMRMSAPCWIATAIAPGLASPYATPAIALRTDVPPPCDAMMPVTSAPSSLKNPLYNATANGMPFADEP